MRRGKKQLLHLSEVIGRVAIQGGREGGRAGGREGGTEGGQAHTYLEHLIRGRLNARHHVRRREGQLLYLSKVVGRITVQDHAAHFLKRVVLVGPDLGHVEGVEGGGLEGGEGGREGEGRREGGREGEEGKEGGREGGREGGKGERGESGK